MPFEVPSPTTSKSRLWFSIFFFGTLSVAAAAAGGVFAFLIFDPHGGVYAGGCSLIAFGFAFVFASAAYQLLRPKPVEVPNGSN